MKRLTTFLFALLLAGIGAWAQSVDVSSKLPGNAQSNWTGATGTYNSVAAERYQTANYTASDGKVLYQSISGLDDGIYEVTFYAVASSTTDRGFDNIYGTGFAQVFANSTVMDVTVFDQTGCTPSDYEYTLTCEVTNGTLEYGLQNVGTGGNWYVCQGISLVYSGQALNTGDTYYASVADLCQWSISPTPGSGETFERNFWSTEADASNMVTPFLQYWHGSGNNLDDAVISHKTLTGLTPGLYEVSVFARAFNEGSTTAVGEGITFTANSKSVDLTTGTSGTYGSSAEVYGTYTLVAEVTEAGTLAIGFTIQSETSCDWLAWKNLKIVYDGEALPNLEYVDGIMNADVEAAMKAAVDKYNGSKNADDYTAALAAIAAAEASVEYYAPIAAVVEALDEAGLAVWNATANGQAYTSRSLTSEDVSADLAAAQIAQTTEGSDMSYALTTGYWSADQGNGPSDYNGYATETYMEAVYDSYDSEASVGKVLYYTVEGLQPGTYTVTFYAAANMANGVTGDSGSGISVAYANNATTSMTVGTNSAAQITSLDDMTLYTIECKVLTGTLEFGIQNVADGGNWFLGAVNSLTLVSLDVDIEPGDEVHSCVAELSHWTQKFTGSGTNGAYELNTWSDEADASGMVTPFLQTWVVSGEVLSDQTIDHNQLSGLQQGWYSVTVDARIMSETGEDITGTATLTANNDFIYIISDGTDGTYGTETEEYGTYTVQCYVGEDGTLDIGFTIKGANFNWFAWKNLSVVYLGETVEYNVGEATASTTIVMPGQTVTLMFADCTKGDEEATLGVSSSANVTFGETSVTLTPKGTITFTFDVPNDVKIGEYTLNIPASTIVWTLGDETKAGNAAQTITFIVPTTIEDGEYLIVDADGNYLGGGLTWGTQAAIIGKPQFIGFEKQENGTYHLDSHQYNYEDSHYLGTNLYFDSYVADWALVEVEGGYAIYGTADTGTGYLTSNGFQTAATVEATPYAWTLVTMDDIVESMADATGDAPVDVTALIKAPELKRGSNREWYPTWTCTGYSDTENVPNNYSFGLNESTSVANCAESFHSENGFNFSQEITLPKAGYYTLSAKGFYRDDNSETLLLPVLYAGDQTSTFPELNTAANNMAEAYAEFLEGLHQIDAILFEAENDDETITIGFKGEDTSLWNIFGELELLYYGTEEPVLRVHECEADINHWTTTGNNGELVQNTWSTEEDASGMTVPFCQNWIANGSTLTAATISHNTLTGLTPGNYTVSMDIRIFSEAGNEIGTGTTFNANGVSEDLDDTDHDGNEGVYGTETEVYGTYTLDCIVYDDGTLDISIVIPDGATYNWIAWKNLSVTYKGEVETPAIGYATVDKTVVQPGDEVTITFKKVAPEEGSYTLTGTGFTDGNSGITVSYSSSEEGVFTFTVPSNAEYNSTFTITIPEGQLYYTSSGSTVVSSEAQTLTFSVPYVLSDELMSGMFLKNLYGGDLLSRGKNYGTRADVDFVGIPVNLTVNDDGKYTIWYADVNPELDVNAYLYGTNWAWSDGTATTATAFSIEEAYDETTGELLGYHFISENGYLYRYDAEKANADDTDDDYALAVNGVKGENFSDDSQIIWTFVDTTERDEIKAQWVADQKVALAAEAGLTGVTTAEEFDTYVAGLTTTMIESDALTYSLTGWTAENSPTVSADGYGVEAFEKYAHLQRTITGLEPGLYKVTLNGLDRNCGNVYSYNMYNDGYTDLSESYLYANGYEINLKTWASEATYTDGAYTPNDMAGASGMFGDGTESSSYLNTLYTCVGEDGSLDIDIALLVPESSGWAIVKNYKLYYLGDKALEIGSDDEYAKDSVVAVDGTTYKVLGGNLLTNGGFNEGTTGWTAGNGYTDALATDAVKIFWGGYNGLPYITLPQAVGASNAATPTQAVQIESGKTYLFIGYTSGITPDTGNEEFSSLYEMSGATTEVSENEHSIPYVTLEWGADANATSTTWTRTMEVFEASTGYAGMRMNWSTGNYDGFQLYEVEATGVEWEMTSVEWGTLILPFAADIPTVTDEGTAATLTVYTCDELESDGTTLTLVEAKTIEACTPYILSGTAGTYTFSGVAINTEDRYTVGLLTGTLVDMSQENNDFTADSGQYVLQNHEDGGLAFYQITSESTGVTLSAYHCFLAYTGTEPAALRIPGKATGIVAVEGGVIANGAIYDLAGRKVSKAVKGIYIQNGKKVLVK